MFTWVDDEKRAQLLLVIWPSLIQDEDMLMSKEFVSNKSIMVRELCLQQCSKVFCELNIATIHLIETWNQ